MNMKCLITLLSYLGFFASLYFVVAGRLPVIRLVIFMFFAAAVTVSAQIIDPPRLKRIMTFGLLIAGIAMIIGGIVYICGDAQRTMNGLLYLFYGALTLIICGMQA